VHPYAIRMKALWYIADVPFSYMAEGGRYLVFCDLLHDILGSTRRPRPRPWCGLRT